MGKLIKKEKKGNIAIGDEAYSVGRYLYVEKAQVQASLNCLNSCNFEPKKTLGVEEKGEGRDKFDVSLYHIN